METGCLPMKRRSQSVSASTSSTYGESIITTSSMKRTLTTMASGHTTDCNGLLTGERRFQFDHLPRIKNGFAVDNRAGIRNGVGPFSQSQKKKTCLAAQKEAPPNRKRGALTKGRQTTMKTNSTHPCYEAHDKAAAGKCQSEVDQDLIFEWQFIWVIVINRDICPMSSIVLT